MFPNKMTGDPNQQNPSSIFGYDIYPPQNMQSVNWNDAQIPQAGVISPTNQFNEANMFDSPSFGVPNFSFSTHKPEQPVVHFPFQITSGFGTTTSITRCKRKTDSPPPVACKQHITEEKMAEHMSKLHISSETASSSKETDNTRTQRLYMCEEMRKLQTESVLPQCLLTKLQRPCTALVLWQPPSRLIPNIIENNNEEAQDNNQEIEDIDIEYNNLDMDL